jgi:hypothetical protein
MKGEVCEVCKKKTTGKDYFKLCRKCQPAWRIGFVQGRKLVTGKILQALFAEDK